MEKSFKNTFVTAVLLSLFFISCNSDDDGGNNNENETSGLVGTWKITERIEDGETIALIPGCEAESGYVFQSDNRYIENDFVTVNLGNDTRCDDDGIPGSWTISDNILTLNYDAVDGEPAFLLEFEFELTGDTLVLNYTEGNFTERSTYTRI